MAYIIFSFIVLWSSGYTYFGISTTSESLPSVCLLAFFLDLRSSKLRDIIRIRLTDPGVLREAVGVLGVPSAAALLLELSVRWRVDTSRLWSHTLLHVEFEAQLETEPPYVSSCYSENDDKRQPTNRTHWTGGGVAGFSSSTSAPSAPLSSSSPWSPPSTSSSSSTFSLSSLVSSSLQNECQHDHIHMVVALYVRSLCICHLSVTTYQLYIPTTDTSKYLLFIAIINECLVLFFFLFWCLTAKG